MDFVVVGLILGAVAVLAGVALLGWTAPRAGRAVTRATSPREAARAAAGAASVRNGGGLLLAAGGLIFLVTIGALLGSADDRTGALAIASTATLIALGILAWGFQNRFTIPWLAPRGRPSSHHRVSEQRRLPGPSPAPAAESAEAKPVDLAAPLVWDEGDEDLDPEHDIDLVDDDSSADAVEDDAAAPSPADEADAVGVGSSASRISGDS